MRWLPKFKYPGNKSQPLLVCRAGLYPVSGFWRWIPKINELGVFSDGIEISTQRGTRRLLRPAAISRGTIHLNTDSGKFSMKAFSPLFDGQDAALTRLLFTIFQAHLAGDVPRRDELAAQYRKIVQTYWLIAGSTLSLSFLPLLLTLATATNPPFDAVLKTMPFWGMLPMVIVLYVPGWYAKRVVRRLTDV